MRVTILGGSAACPNPRQACSGYLLSDPDTALLIDCGPGVVPELLAHRPLDALDGILISHLHSDHVLDIVPLRYGLKYAPGLRRRRLPLWLPPGGTSFLEKLAAVIAHGDETSTTFFTETFEIAEYDPSGVLSFGQWSITFHPTRHWIPCWAIRIRNGERTVAYTSDTGWDDTLVPFLHGADVLIIEATLSEASSEGERTGHLTLRQAATMAALADVERVVVTHYWAGEEFTRELAEAAHFFGRPVEVARPGLTIDVAEEVP